MYIRYSSSYEQATSSTYSSTIKTVVDNWYKTNIQDAGYSDKVADVIYCNDRSLYSGTGYGSNETYYGAYQRIVDGNNPVLTCTNQNDRFTADDTSKGNEALTYPVGLITADEVTMSGGVSGLTNSNYYLYTGQIYWTMSPYYFSDSVPVVFVVSYDGYINYNSVNDTYAIRPVISLKSSVTLTGSGTQTDPWVVQN